MAGAGPEAIHCGEAEITNRSIALDCGDEDTSSWSERIRDLDPVLDEAFNEREPQSGLGSRTDKNGMRR